ncbi:anaphase-promoting complex subunit 1 isoform X5 [Eucalyptus grandis]|uniref:anaphase-promoting complex subunit 1 isoform X5 n=1 Tax=Eucalyptus grandis TaxID=71139 RepID=UPI00192EB589|nr:anaphase-promoting complex subunit 1 isoform X5 [Eucalyptus grandis]
MSPGARHLNVLGEFKPFGLVAEALDGKPQDDSAAAADKYDYFLFDSSVAREASSGAAATSGSGDHEIFIRGNRIIWTAGSRVYKRFTVASPVIMACWCHLGDMAEAFLCVLQADSLTVYNASGEVVTIPLPQSISSIWPLPFGLLLEQAAEGDFPRNIHFSSSILASGASDTSHPRREIGHSPQSNFSCMSPYDNVLKGDTALLSSHLILKDPMEDPQFVYVEDRGKLNIMNDYNERTIWTSEQVPLMASYNKGKAQHSLWVAEVVNPTADEVMSNLPDINPLGVRMKQFSFHRIWQGKGAHAAACKVFMAIDDDTTPIVCFLLQGQKKLLSLRLQIYETSSDVLFDVKPDMSWSIPAVSAAPVVVTRPGVKLGLLPHTDIIVLTPENTLLLYSGKLCLCRYLLPSCLSRCRHLHNMEFSGNVAVSHDVKIIGLADAVEGRVNIVISNGQMFRCALHQSPSSSLVKDCMEAMAEGMISSLYNHFLTLLWGDNDITYLSKADSSVDSEWVSFSSLMLQMCRRSTYISEKFPVSTCQSSWDFLVNSQFHQNYCKLSSFTGASSQAVLESQAVDCSRSVTEAKPTGDSTFYSELLVKSLDSLHAVYESLKLDNLRKLDLELLAVLLCNIAKFLGEECYIDHYVRDFPYLFNNLGTHNTSLSRRSPPNLFRWLENCLLHGFSSADTNDLPPLIRKEGSFAASRAKKIVSFYSLLFSAQKTGDNLPCGVCCNVATGSYSTAEEHTVLAMVGEKFGLQQLDSLPPGVSLPLRHALDKCRESPPTDWPAAAYVLLGREDLALTRLERPCKTSVQEAQANENLIEMSTPYMLHLHPVTIPSVVFDSFGSENAKFEDADSTDGSVTDGMEHIFTSCTQLRYGRDLRLNEVRRLLSSARPVAIQTSVNPSASDQDLQQVQLWQFAQRTTALPIGRGAFTLATIYTLLTEAFTVPKLVLAGRLPAQQNATVNLDPNTRNIQELKSWPDFHNAVAAGLRLAPLQGKVSRTWIIYNKPEEPNAVHAGLLLALGLHGYLRVLSITDIYQYFSQVLYVHIPARHPSTFPELELPTLLQSEIGRRSGGDNVLEREGYAVSAGFSLGLVALGRGLDMLGFVETLLDRLFDYIGGKELHSERSYLLTPSTEEHNRGFGQMMDTAAFNVDVTAPGAIVALALMFLKTESEVILSRLSIPCTQFDLQYVRPDFIMLRVIARNMIMWSRVHPSKNWIESQVPEIVKIGVEGLREDVENLMETDVEALVQAYINIVAGACISLGLKFAGTMDGNAQELLYEYAVYFLNEMKPVAPVSGSNFPKGLANYVDRGTLEICLHLIVLSLSVVMAGSGHLQTLRLLKFLRGRNSADGHSNYGTQMTISLAIGFLFLGGGMRTFSTSNSSIAALLITLYPRLPAGPNDNRCHLQAFRHLYVLATEARWIQTIDVDTGLPVYAPLEVTIKESENYSETSFCEITPCILPERSILKSVRVCGPRYWTQVINLVPEEKPWWTDGAKNDPFNSGTLYIKRKVGACSYVDDPIGCQSLLSQAMHKVFSMTNLRASSGNTAGNYISVDQLVSTFSSVPSLIAFAQLCRDPSWNSRPDVDFQEFCVQVLFECVSKDRPALLQVYLSLYTTMELMADLVKNNNDVLCDSVSVSSLKLALAYTQASLGGKLTNARGSVVQSIFIGSLRKRLEDLFQFSRHLSDDLHSYLTLGRWPADGSDGKRRSIILSWYLQWFGIPSPSVVEKAVKKVNAKSVSSSSSVPLLRLLLPTTHISALSEIGRLLCSS